MAADGEQIQHWDEYIKVVDRFTDIIDIPAKLPMLRVLAICIRKLEKVVGIPRNQSELLGVNGIPLEVTTGDVDTASSNITTSRAIIQSTNLVLLVLVLVLVSLVQLLPQLAICASCYHCFYNAF